MRACLMNSTDSLVPLQITVTEATVIELKASVAEWQRKFCDVVAHRDRRLLEFTKSFDQLDVCNDLPAICMHVY